ncbi:MAG: hypothetical protein K8I60_17105 [Anaerolineae bacterium]|nr:hypothetical protein [Anaerolineae bacterium]
MSADNLTPLIGEPVHLTLSVQAPDGTEILWPNFVTVFAPFVVSDVGAAEVSTSGTMQTFRRVLTVILWQPGDYQTPDLSLDIKLPGESEPRQLQVDSLFFTVPSVLNPDDLNLRPLKPQIALPYVSTVLIIAGSLGVLGGVSAAWYWRGRIGVFRQPPPASDLHPAAQAALVRIQRASNNQDAVASYQIGADALRAYVQGRFHVQAEEMTTDELINTLESHDHLPTRRQRELGWMLEQADLVKFARVQPSLKAAQRLLNAAYEWVERVDRESDMGQES